MVLYRQKSPVNLSLYCYMQTHLLFYCRASSPAVCVVLVSHEPLRVCMGMLSCLPHVLCCTQPCVCLHIQTRLVCLLARMSVSAWALESVLCTGHDRQAPARPQPRARAPELVAFYRRLRTQVIIKRAAVGHDPQAPVRSQPHAHILS